VPMRKLRLVWNLMAVSPRMVATIRIISPRIPEKRVMITIKKIRIV